MKDLVNKFISNLHYIIIAYAIYAAWGMYEEHSLRMTELDAQFPTVEAEIVANTKKVKEIQDFVKKAEESKVRVEEVAKNIESAQKQLPAEINDGQIVTFFSGEMDTLNIKDAKTTPGQELASTYFISKEYTVNASGTFLQFLIFLERLGNSTRIYNVKSLKLTNTDAVQRGRFHLVSAELKIDAYRFNPDFKVERGFENLAPTP